MLKKLDRKEMEEIYRTQMQSDFPPAELKPWKRIKEMLEEGIYFAYGMYEEEKLLAYAFFVRAGKEQLLLDYYAVAEQARGMGIGSRCMALFCGELQEQGGSIILIEVENPDCAETDEERKSGKGAYIFTKKTGRISQGFVPVCLG